MIMAKFFAAIILVVALSQKSYVSATEAQEMSDSNLQEYYARKVDTMIESLDEEEITGLRTEEEEAYSSQDDSDDEDDDDDYEIIAQDFSADKAKSQFIGVIVKIVKIIRGVIKRSIRACLRRSRCRNLLFKVGRRICRRRKRFCKFVLRIICRGRRRRKCRRYNVKSRILG